MKKYLIPVLTAAILFTGASTRAEDSVYEFKVKNIEGKDVDLSEYKGKVLLIVNVASKCGATPQYDPLQALYKKYADKGLVVLGFPANNFGGQEPGTDTEIAEFCTSKYSVEFPMFSKVSVKGDDKAPLFSYLTSAENPDKQGDIGWNFEKFLIGKDGKLIRRFATKVDPTNADLVAAIETALK
ncbi:MAG TPA: glutathione peroxidase [Verrucomicrobiales bacterium]|nr:glutathione peroxidase [Verrucomicrobiales bacterium]